MGRGAVEWAHTIRVCPLTPETSRPHYKSVSPYTEDLPDTSVVLVLLNSIPAFYAEHRGFWVVPFLLAWRQLAYKVRIT